MWRFFHHTLGKPALSFIFSQWQIRFKIRQKDGNTKTKEHFSSCSQCHQTTTTVSAKPQKNRIQSPFSDTPKKWRASCNGLICSNVSIFYSYFSISVLEITKDGKPSVHLRSVLAVGSRKARLVREIAAPFWRRFSSTCRFVLAATIEQSASVCTTVSCS